ncbi:glycosyltransferase family 4 protein [Megamonas funiformis]
MKKIVFNGKLLLRDEKRGVYRYTYEILKSIDKLIDNTNIEIEIIVPNVNREIPKFDNIKVIKYGRKNVFKCWQYIDYQYYILKNNVIPVSLSPDLASIVRKGINTFHDMRIEHRMKEKMDIKSFFKYLIFFIRNYIVIKRSKYLIFVSDFVRNEFINYYNIEKEKTVVVYNAWQHLLNVSFDEKKLIIKYKKILEKDFYFYIGGQEKNKNIKWILEVAKKNKKDLFIIAGPVNRIIDNNINNLIYIGYITDEEMAFFMKKCKAFVFPSIYEGFGIPPLEALYFGSKVICSDRSCLPEIYKNYVIYINPYNYNINLDELVDMKVEDAKNLLKLYSWDRSAEIILDIIKRQ